jgi:hypothetical protein
MSVGVHASLHRLSHALTTDARHTPPATCTVGHGTFPLIYFIGLGILETFTVCFDNKGVCSVKQIFSRTRDWPACVKFHAAGDTQF